MPSALEIIHIITPSVLTLPVLSLLPSPSLSPPDLPGVRAVTVKTVTPRRGFILLTLVLLAATCALEAIVLIVDIFTARYRQAPQHGAPHTLDAWFVASSVAHSLGGLCVYAAAALLAEWRTRWGDKNLVLLSLLGFGLEVPNLVLSVIYEVHADPTDKVFAILNIPPSCLRLILLPILGVLVLNPIVRYETPTERTSLLGHDGAPTANEADVESNAANGSPSRGRLAAPTATTQYGTFDGNSGGNGGSSSRDASIVTRTSTDTPQPQADNAPATEGTAATPNQKKSKINIPKQLGEKKEEYQGISWKAFWSRLKKLWPHLWPSTSWKLQVCCVLCVALIFVGRGVNALVPMTIGQIVRALTASEHGGNGASPWPPLIFYILLRSMQSGGVLAFLQNVIWVPVQQYADREMQMLTFNHLLDLSLAFHTKRNTGEVLRIIDRGSAINNLFQTLLFTAAPTVLDILLYSAIFFNLYGPLLSTYMMGIMALYVGFSITFTSYRTKLRREMVEKDIKSRGIASDVLTNWESVKYFTAESRESRRFRDSVVTYQATEAKVTVSFNLLNLGQNFIMTMGLLGGCLMVALQILNGPWDQDMKPDAASFVTFLMYIQQLYGPLDRFGTLYRQLNVNATDAEKLFNLLAQPTEIKDVPGAPELVVTDGVIEFDNVCFSYNENVQALKGVSFTIGKGESMALVGESGSGKSTILRLLYRFYDIDSGTIYIDGQDISKVTQLSLRRAIGIVPQDSVLWNDTIGANISYGKEGATDEEIIAAAKAARLHDRILTFPEGYATIVGERGVRLSGGEKQRVSLARMFLKSPAILVLDEATSALDTETEREIQKSLAELARGRSSLSIAHRLSTIINSDQIVVMREGRVIEHGSYHELLDMDGQFATMWKKQIFTEAEMTAGTSSYAHALMAPPSFGSSTPTYAPEKAATDGVDTGALVIHRASPPSTVNEQEDEPVGEDLTPAAAYEVTPTAPAVELPKAAAEPAAAAAEPAPDATSPTAPGAPSYAAVAAEEPTVELAESPAVTQSSTAPTTAETASAPVSAPTLTAESSSTPPVSYAAVASEPPASDAATTTTTANRLSAAPSVRFDDSSAPPSRPDSPTKKPRAPVAFPDAAPDTPRSSNDSPRPSAARLLSGASSRGSAGVSEHSAPSDSGAEAPPEKRRKRLSSIKGFVRRRTSSEHQPSAASNLLLSRSSSNGGAASSGARSDSDGGKKRNTIKKRLSVHE